jgi:primase-polymerase (primpol)-like protein
MTTAPTIEKLKSVRLDGIPHDMRAVARWGVWRYEERAGERTKVPYSVVTGERASSTRLTDWTSFDLAAAYWIRKRQHDGLAFVLGDGWAGIDLDGCRDPESGEIHPKAQKIITTIDSYTEVSPSGTGLKIFVHGALPPGRRKLEEVFGKGEHAGIEMYDSGRYFCVTGCRHDR